MKLSVIICTHQPRADYLARTLAGLRHQTLAPSSWELRVVDNASVPPLVLDGLLSWHPDARVVREPIPGLVSARLRGISEATGELLVFVDDDNVLAPDYLATALAIARVEPELGVFGGQILGEFEIPPSPWFAARLDRLAIREFSAETRTRQLDAALAPCGAGLCVRTSVAEAYRAKALNDPTRRALGRNGRSLGAGDDTDLAFTACDLGLAMGRFPSLKLFHLIPRSRLTLRYFARVTKGHARAQLNLLALRPAMIDSHHSARTARLALWKWSVIDSALSLLPQRGSQP